MLEDFGFPYKCELCDGEPQCVQVCKPKALEYVELDRFQRQRAQQEAARLCGALQGRHTSKGDEQQAEKE